MHLGHRFLLHNDSLAMPQRFRTPLFALAVLLFAGTRQADAQAQVVFVNAGAPANGDGITWQTAFNSLDDALAPPIPAEGREVWVAEGTYSPQTVEGFRVRANTRVLGGFSGTESSLAERNGNPDACILTGDLAGDDEVGGLSDNALHVVQRIGGTPAGPVTIDGFQIIGGRATGNGAEGAGGGLFITGDGLTEVRHVTFRGNFAVTGAGLRMFVSPGIFLDVLVADCRFVANHSSGGAAGLQASRDALRVLRCDFEGNTTDASGTALRAGNMDTLEVASCRFIDNVAQGGSGAGIVSVSQGRGRFVNCVFARNRAEFTAAGTFDIGSAIDFDSCTFVANFSPTQGGGIATLNGSDVRLRNTILWGNAVPGLPAEQQQLFIAATASVTADNCNIEGLVTSLGSGNISGDPNFVDEPSVGSTDPFNLQIGAASSCLDAGSVLLLPADSLDLDGDGDTSEQVSLDLVGTHRIVGLETDIGALEASDCDANGVLDGDDIAADPTLDCDGDGQLDLCQILADPGLDLDQDGALDDCASLVGAPPTLSVAAGGTHTLLLDAGIKNAGEIYFLLGTISGTTPGQDFGALSLPLNADGYFNLTLLSPSLGVITSPIGVLDGVGQAAASISFAAGAVPSLAGITGHHAYVLLGSGFVSNPAPLTLLP